MHETREFRVETSGKVQKLILEIVLRLLFALQVYSEGTEGIDRDTEFSGIKK